MQPSPSSFSAAKAIPKAAAAPVATDTEDDDDQPSSTEDDAPLSSLVPPRRPGSNISSHGSASPVNSTVTLPIRAQSPALSTRTATTHKSRSSLAGIMPTEVPRTTPTPEPRMGSANLRASPAPKEPSPEPKSPLARGRKPLIDLTSSAPTVVASPSQSTTSPPAMSSSQSSLLTPPISEQGFSPPSQAETARRQSPGPASSFLRPAPSAIQRSHDRIARPLTREDSPASSIGSGLYPNTPGTGSDAGMSMKFSQSVVTSSSGSSGNDRPTGPGGKRLSITFDDSVVFSQKKGLHHRRGASGDSTASTTSRTSLEKQEEKRNERRRSEARASVEVCSIRIFKALFLMIS